ncbi:hypothetical protein, partial [Bradyrhizobium sp.]|uniref:hypothetical protein n=1 Tax=Bradyrhizobium sp. TaxID=376 RepID=UPI003C7205EA
KNPGLPPWVIFMYSPTRPFGERKMISTIGIVAVVILFWADLEKAKSLKWYAAGICSLVIVLEMMGKN